MKRYPTYIYESVVVWSSRDGGGGGGASFSLLTHHMIQPKKVAQDFLNFEIEKEELTTDNGCSFSVTKSFAQQLLIHVGSLYGWHLHLMAAVKLGKI